MKTRQCTKRVRLPVCLGCGLLAASACFAEPQVVISFPVVAYVDMPVWARIDLIDTEKLGLFQDNVRYPFSDQPGEFGPFTLESRRDGKALPLITSLIGVHGGMGSAAPPDAPKNRIPVHLGYRFKEPGVYEVRCRVTYDLSVPNGALSSEWKILVVAPFSESQRRQWLERRRANPPQSTGLLVGDYLPSILAKPDDDVLRIILGYMHHPNSLVQGYAVYSLDYFEADSLRQTIPELIAEKGPTDYLAHYLSLRREIYQPVAGRLVDLLIPFLQSSSPSQAGAAVEALGFLKGHYDWRQQPGVPADVDRAVWRAIDHLKGFTQHEALGPLCCYLGQIKSDESRAVLWQLAERRAAREQALICLTWIGDRRDLEPLGRSLLAGEQVAGSLPCLLRQAYGEAAIPHLSRALARSSNERVRRECEKELSGSTRPASSRPSTRPSAG